MSGGRQPGRWLEEDRAELAAERILDAAAPLFQARGVAGVTMDEVARAAGCSRATVYRYFDDRVALRTAFVHRETRRVGAAVAAAIVTIDDPVDRVVEATRCALAEVRRRPELLAWFEGRNAEVTTDLVSGSAVIQGLAAGLIGPREQDGPDRAEWLIRALVSFLLFPGRSEEEETALIRRFVAPVVAG